MQYRENTALDLKRPIEVWTEGDVFQNLATTITDATHYYYASIFIHRNDATGKQIGQAFIHAANNNVQGIIAKDRIGYFYERGEGNSQSWVHDTHNTSGFHGSLRTMVPQAQLIHLVNQTPFQIQRPSKQKEWLLQFENIQLFDQHKLYDHSKVFDIDGKKLILGDTNIGDDFNAQASQVPWITYTLAIDDPRLIEQYQKIQLGSSDLPSAYEETDAILTEERLEREGSSFPEYFINFIRGTESHLVIEMAYLGNPKIIDALAEILKSGKTVQIITSKHGNVHRARNWHFFKTLQRKSGNSGNLQIYASTQPVHAKLMIRDGNIIVIGSANLSMDAGVMNETNLVSSDPYLIQQILSHIEVHQTQSEIIEELPSWARIIIPSRIDWASVKAQTFLASYIRRNRILQSRQEIRDAYEKLLEQYA